MKNYTEKLLEKSSFERAWTPAATRDGKPAHYGYVWAISTLRGARALEHGGGIFGFSTYGIRLPDEKVYVAVLANSDSPKADPGMLGKRIAALLIGRPGGRCPRSERGDRLLLLCREGDVEELVLQDLRRGGRLEPKVVLGGADERRLRDEADDLGADDRNAEALGLGPHRFEDAV